MGRPATGPEFFEHRVTAYLEDHFRSLGVPYERQPIAPLRDNIVACSEAAPPLPSQEGARSASSPHAEGARRGRTILFEVHQDTVPADNMTIDPFGARVENGRLYGRGACDVKGGLAAMLAAFSRLVRERPRGAATVILACVVDEEFTFRGISELVRRGVRADLAIVAEPTNLDIVNAHKGVVRWHLHTHGRACHSSSPEHGVNAIYRMARLVSGIEQFAERLRATRADPLLGPPTISVGRIEGGVSVNIVPERCTIEIDRRLVTDEDPHAAPEELTAYLRALPGVDFPFTTDPPWMSKPPLSPRLSAEACARLGAAIDAVRGSHRVVSVPYGTDASTLADAGIPSVVFGPGDIAKAHTCDEWVPLDEVEQASEILYRLALPE